jgi:hypothetical protein
MFFTVYVTVVQKGRNLGTRVWQALFVCSYSKQFLNCFACLQVKNGSLEPEEMETLHTEDVVFHIDGSCRLICVAKKTVQ